MNFTLYTPLLPGAAAGRLKPRYGVAPPREHLDSVDLIHAPVTGADPPCDCCASRSTPHRSRVIAALPPLPRRPDGLVVEVTDGTAA